MIHWIKRQLRPYKWVLCKTNFPTANGYSVIKKGRFTGSTTVQDKNLPFKTAMEIINRLNSGDDLRNRKPNRVDRRVSAG